MIPLSVPNLSGNEWKYVKDCLDTNWVSSVGSYVTLFEKRVAEFCHVNHAIATSSGTTALHVSLLLSGVQAGDLVLVPNITFVASVNSIKYTGADPVLIDVDPFTWQMDLELLHEFLQKETIVNNGVCLHRTTNRVIRAIMPVHVLGNMCDMHCLMEIAAQYNLVIVEDATESLGSNYKGKPAGSFGLFGCLSFNGNKIITTGGGGMLLTNNEELAKKAKHITTQAKADGEEYYHDEIGYNYRLVNILAAMGVAQMEQLPSFVERKKEIAAVYTKALTAINQAIQPQRITSGVDANHWLYTVRVPKQQDLRKHLRTNGIEARPFWVPMNQLPSFQRCIYYQRLNNSEEIYKNCLSLPCSSQITNDQVNQVIDLIRKFYNE
jgi:perosamine synthetase